MAVILCRLARTSLSETRERAPWVFNEQGLQTDRVAGMSTLKPVSPRQHLILVTVAELVRQRVAWQVEVAGKTVMLHISNCSLLQRAF